MKYRYEIKQSNNPSLSSADTFKTAVKALAVAKQDCERIYPNRVSDAILRVFDEDGIMVLVYEKYGSGWVKRQTATEAW